MGFAFFVPRAAAGHGSYIKKGKGKNMIIVLKANRSKEQVKNFISDLTDRYDVSVNTWVGTHSTVLRPYRRYRCGRQRVYRRTGYCRKC